MQEKVFQTHI